MALMLTRPGLFAGAVYNGYFLMTSGIASLMLLVRKFHIHRIIPWLIIMLGCICVQERGPIIILAVLSAFAFYRLFHIRKNRYALLLIVFALAVYYLTSFISLFTFGRTEPVETHITYIETDEDESDSESSFSGIMKESRFAEMGIKDTGRENIYSKTIDYLMDHPFIGGLHRLRAKYGIYPHNLFINAFAFGGFVGGVAILLILFWQIKPLWRVLRRKIADTNPVCFFTGLAYVAYTLNSLVHNRSIVTGDEVIWMLWGLFYFEYLKYHPRGTRL
jgi:O-antigen ligase